MVPVKNLPVFEAPVCVITTVLYCPDVESDKTRNFGGNSRNYTVVGVMQLV